MNAQIGSILTLIAASLSMLFGLIYFIKPKFMGYHKAALQKEWNELGPEVRTLILALMRALGSGLISVAIAMIILQLEFNRTENAWIAWTILVIGSIVTAGSFYAMLLVRTKTKGRPPILAILINFVVLVAGFLFNILG